MPAVSVLLRTGVRVGLAGLALFGAVSALQNAAAEGDTRTLSFHHVHTGESLTVTFERDGHYVPSALKQLDWLMRDWRRGRETHMDPHLFDILWRVYHEVGASKPIQIICGYRAPTTNAMLRARSHGVAEYSQHILGKAIDFYIPGVPLAKIRKVGLELQRGGVGFYPRSGSPFVHLDVGTVRHWPGVSRVALLKIFPHGRTVHIPADGRPLPGYAQALAEIERRGDVPNARSLKAARAAGLITAKEAQVAELVGRARRQELVAMVNSGTAHDYGAPGEAPLSVEGPTLLASLNPAKLRHRANVPLPLARPQVLAQTARVPAGAPAMTVAANDLVAMRDIWDSGVEAGPPLAPAQASPFDVAAAEPLATGSTGDDVLAYAPESAPPLTPARRAQPMGAHIPGLISTAYAHTAAADGVVATTTLYSAPMEIGGQKWGSPWLRAALLTPSVSNFMTATRMGKADPRWERELLAKPARSVVMTFAPDPHYGMVTDHFTGSAVVFLATASFGKTQTASLQ